MTDDELQLLLSLFARQKEIGQVILYGSRAMGTHKPFSDVDITLIGIGLKRSHLTRLMAEIDESILPYSFDISIFSQLTNPDLIEQIEKTGIVLYSREGNAFVAEPWNSSSSFPKNAFIISITHQNQLKTSTFVKNELVKLLTTIFKKDQSCPIVKTRFCIAFFWNLCVFNLKVHVFNGFLRGCQAKKWLIFHAES